jgi:hypothetical protein
MERYTGGMDDKPRSHVLLCLVAAFVAGLIVGGVGVYTKSDYRKATEHLLEENRILKQMNKLQAQELEEIQRVLAQPESVADPAKTDAP